MLYTNYGYSRIDFGQPFSLKEFIQNSKVRTTRPSITVPATTTPPESPSSSTQQQNSTPSLPFLSANSITPGHHRSLSSPPESEHVALRRSSSNPFSDPNPQSTNGNLIGARSNSSLFGTEVNDEYRQLVNSLASHIVYGKYIILIHRIRII